MHGYYTELLLDQIRNSQEEQQTPNITQVHECLLSTKSHIFVRTVADIYYASNIINNAMLQYISVQGSLGTYMGLLTGDYRIEVRNTNSNTN
jgi:hypothetical protein